MRFDIQQVSLAGIHADEETYRITTKIDTDIIAASIAKTGLINPPIIIQKDSNFVIVSGFRRIAAARFLGWGQLPVRILDRAASHLDCIQIAIADNAAQRPLNPIEVSRSLSLLSACFHSEPALSRITAELGLPSSVQLMKKLIPLCKLPAEVQAGVINDTISLQIAQMLYPLDPQIAIWFAHLFKSLKISLNKQREIITLTQEIALREDIPLIAVVEDKSLRGILDNPDLDRSGKASAARAFLKQRRYPALTRAKDAFEAILKSLRFENTVKLIPPADFEGTNYSLNLSFQRLCELEAHKKIIDRILTHPEIKRLIDADE